MTSAAWLLTAALAMANGQANPAGPESKQSSTAWASPGHEQLDLLAGSFKVERTTDIPGSATKRTTGVSENRWILGKRYLEFRGRDGEGDSAEESVWLFGFDVRRRAYFVLMVGSRGTNYVTLEGFYDTPARSFVLIGRAAGDGPGSGPKLRQVIRLEGKDQFVVETFVVPLGKLPQKVGQITYTRQ